MFHQGVSQYGRLKWLPGRVTSRFPTHTSLGSKVRPLDLSSSIEAVKTYPPLSIALSIDSVRHTLAQQEADDVRNKKSFSLHEVVSASQLITMGIELEDQQYVYSHFTCPVH